MIGDPITSLKNPRVKEAFKLRDAKARRQRGVFAFEGAREILRAIDHGFDLEELFCCEALFSDLAKSVVQTVDPGKLVPINEEVFAKLAVRSSVDGLWAVFKTKEFDLQTYSSEAPLLLGLHGLEKPGNVGALYRSADGAGVDGVIRLEGTSDPFSHNSIRSSLGTVFSRPTYASQLNAMMEFAQKNKLQILSAALSSDAVPYTEPDYTIPTLIVLGSEDQGLPKSFLEHSQVVQIPMLGTADSLNVSVAGAIIMYEARRQRSIAKLG
jgi:TrmH family RNA methyltransferase